jgi:hypothetical protein
MQRSSHVTNPCWKIFLVFVFLTLAAGFVRADDRSLVGKNVYPKSPVILVKHGTETIATGAELSFPIVVRQQTGDSVTIWVNKSKQEGQISRQDILTAGEAIPI